MRCEMCGGKLVRDKNDPEILFCDNCGLSELAYNIEENELDEFYENLRKIKKERIK